jgi:hypothetical protein
MGIESTGEIKSKEAEEIRENPTWKGKTWEMKRPGRWRGGGIESVRGGGGGVWERKSERGDEEANVWERESVR